MAGGIVQSSSAEVSRGSAWIVSDALARWQALHHFGRIHRWTELGEWPQRLVAVLSFRRRAVGSGRLVEHLDRQGEWRDPRELLDASAKRRCYCADARMHKPDPKLPLDKQDKRSLVPVALESVDQWLNGNHEEAAALLSLTPAEVWAGPLETPVV